MVERLIVFEGKSGCVVVVVVVQMKTVELRRSCIPDVRLQLSENDVEVNDVVIGMVIDVEIDVVIDVVQVVEVVGVLVVVEVVAVAVAALVPLETDAVEVEQ